MTAPAKINRLMSMLAIGFVLSCRVGEAEDKRRPIKVKKHGRPVQSLFRAGLDRLVSVLFRGMRMLEVLGGEVMIYWRSRRMWDEGFFVVYEGG